MGLADLFNKSEALIAVDIGSTSVKLIELDMTAPRPKLVNVGVARFKGDVFSGNTIARTEVVSEQVNSLLELNSVEDRRVVTAMPGPSVFTKKIKMPKLEIGELSSNINFEAGNFIPHNIDAVKLDFHVVGSAGKNQLDILVVAVKNEIIDSYIDCLALSGLETAVVDVDYYALQNVFEIGYPELVDETVAIINVGARYSAINICTGGQSLFTGDIAVGGRSFTDSIQAELGVTLEEAEQLKIGENADDERAASVREIVDRQLEQVASDFNRQLSFFWNASGAEDGIDRIMLCGGGSRVPRLVEELSEKTGLECGVLDAFKGIDVSEGFDSTYLDEIAPIMPVCVGMGIRQPGDREIPDWD